MKLIDYLFEFFQRRCPHDPGYVTADILEGATKDLQVQWCRRCGAARVVNDGREWDWREPRATWWVKRGIGNPSAAERAA